MQRENCSRICEIILWDIEPYAQEISQAIQSCSIAGGHSVRIRCWSWLETQRVQNTGRVFSCLERYLLFYRAGDWEGETEARHFALIYGLNVFFVALCADYKQAIRAMEQGDHYALELPLMIKKRVHRQAFLGSFERLANPPNEFVSPGFAERRKQHPSLNSALSRFVDTYEQFSPRRGRGENCS